jgi:hypothetical protein
MYTLSHTVKFHHLKQGIKVLNYEFNKFELCNFYCRNHLLGNVVHHQHVSNMELAEDPAVEVSDGSE